MKKLLLYVVAIIIMAPAITSCKKGEEDPFLSLRSRKARLVGEWKLVSGSLALSAGNEVYETSFNGSIATINYGLQQGSIQYSETVTFDKNNAYKIEIVTDGVFESDEGFWSFMTGYGEIANKEYVVLRIAKSIDRKSVV